MVNSKKNLKGLELKYKYTNETTVQLKNNFVNCFDKIDQIVYHAHPTLDLAILEFKGFTNKLYTSHASFIKDSKNINKESIYAVLDFHFQNSTISNMMRQRDDIEWTNDGNAASPTFPLDGIITRFSATVLVK